MVESGYVTREQADEAYDSPLDLISERPTGLQGYRDPYFTTYAIAQLNQLFGESAVEQGGLSVYTTLDERMQRIAQEAVTWGVHQAVAEGIGAHQAALVAIRPSTGEIVAMIGGAGFSLNNQFNRAWQARRQPGSSFKIYDYTAAIDEGIPASTIIDDSHVSYPMGDGTMWTPMDDDDSYMGAITLREALTLSRNVVAVKLAERVGLDKIIGYAHRMGVTVAARSEPFACARFVRSHGARSSEWVLDACESRASHRSDAVSPRERFVGNQPSRQPRSAGHRRGERWNGVYHDVDVRGRDLARHRLSKCGHRTPGCR